MNVILDTSSMASSAAASADSLTSIISSGVGGVVIAIILVVLLASRELIGASSKGSKRILALLDAVAIPVLIVFVATLIFQILELLHVFG